MCSNAIDAYRLLAAALLRFIEDIGQMAFATVLAIMHSSHEYTRSALLTVSTTRIICKHIPDLLSP